MGLSASQARFLQLTARKSDLEFQGQQLNQERTILANKMDQIAVDMNNVLQQQDGNTGYDPTTDPVYLALQNDLDSVQSQDVILEINLKDVDTEHQSTQTEIDSVSKVIDKNIDMTYKTFA